MAMQTIIMAGGEGVRLRPLTHSMPKPLAPLCGEPVMGYTLKLLQRHGINDATATLCYRPEDVMHAFGLRRHGVTLRYCTEDKPLGTAGSVKKAAGHAKDTTLVLSGDGLTACDLTRAYAFHRARGAAATLVLSEVDIPLRYGVVVTKNDGQIIRFVEKPDWSRAVGRLVNTGIYFLEPEVLRLIPQDTPYDFGRQLFPRLLELGLAIYGYVSREYWCDVGDPAAFLRAQGDLLTGRAGFAAADAGIRKLQDGYISFDSYVDSTAHVAPDAIIRGSCVLPGACVESGVRMEGSILCTGAQAGRGSILTEGSILGNGARLEDYSRCEGGRLWAGVRTLPGTVVRTIVQQKPPQLYAREGKAAVRDPGAIAQLAGALVKESRADHLVVMHAKGAQAAYTMWQGALAGYGVRQVNAAGEGTVGILSHAVRMQGASGGILALADGAVLLDSMGKRITAARCAQIQACWQRMEMPGVHASATAICQDTSQRSAYLKHLGDAFGVECGLSIRLRGGEGFVLSLVQDALRMAGHDVCYESEIAISIKGEKLRLQLGERMLDDQTEWLLCSRALNKKGIPVYDTLGFGCAVDGLQIMDESDACVQQQALLEDDLSRMLLILQMLAAEPVEEALQAVPGIACRTIDIPCEVRDKSRVMADLLPDTFPGILGGLEAQRQTACAHIMPDPVLPLLRVTAYARSAENAQELCDVFNKRIRSTLLQEDNEKNGSIRLQ